MLEGKLVDRFCVQGIRFRGTYVKSPSLDPMVRCRCTVQKMKFSMKDFFSKCEQFRIICSHFLHKYLTENFFVCSNDAQKDYFYNSLISFARGLKKGNLLSMAEVWEEVWLRGKEW